MLCSVAAFSLFFVTSIGAFAPIAHTTNARLTGQLFAESDTAKSTLPIKQVLSDQDVIDLASFRNDLTNPEMMVTNAKKKLSGTDNTAKAIEGLAVGLGYVGLPLAAYQFYMTADIISTLKFYLSTGGTIGLILGVNNYMGRSVYVPDVPESTNRIIVDYAEGLKRKQDVGFVVLSDDYKFEPANGVCACVDAQLRNSPNSWPGVQSLDGYPPHFHIKNMKVHESMRRQGLGLALLDTFENWAREETDAEMMTLEVEEENVAAVKLYEKAGFEFIPNPTSFTKRKFMTKKL